MTNKPPGVCTYLADGEPIGPHDETGQGRCGCTMLPLTARMVIAEYIIGQMCGPDGGVDWSDYPDIGEGDWNAILEEIDERAPEVETATYEAAYAVLAERARGAGVR